MLVIPGYAGKDTCDGTTRRDFMRVGGSAVFGLSLADLFRGSARAETAVTKPEGDALARYGANMLPVDQRRRSVTSPIFNYPYSRSREALERMRNANEWDACHGLKMRYINPETGDHAMPTIGAFLQLLPKGFKSSRYRSTDATIFTAVEGSGRSRIGDTTVEWGPKDLFVVPSWNPVVHEASSDAVLFSYSDRPVQEKIGIWREDRGKA